LPADNGDMNVDIFAMFASSALTVLIGSQKEHPAPKNLGDEVLAWLSSGAKCK